jgi:hypothetical protein
MMKLGEEAEFWLGYISDWEANHDEPVPERAQLLLERALLKLVTDFPDKRPGLLFQSNTHKIH